MDNKRTENLRTILEHNLSAEATENLRTIKNEDEFRKVLADNGIQAEKLQRKLPDDLMGTVSGGYDFEGNDVHCPCCGNEEYDHISFQFFTSFKYFADTYQCDLCKTYFQIDAETCQPVKVNI